MLRNSRFGHPSLNLFAVLPFAAVLSLAATIGGCGSEKSDTAATTGSSSSQGGSGAMGGSSSKGGASSQGGSSSKGGAGAQGGSSSKGGASAQGGSGTGGSGTGGAGTGGAGTGGAGTGGAGTGGNMSMASAECTMNSDCKMIDNCCACEGIPNTTPTPACNQLCKASTCQLTGLGTQPTASCRVGRCVAGYDCRWSVVTCKQLQPVCGPGETNSVTGNCWGPCVPATECAEVSKCGQCAPGQRCVMKQAKINGGRHCVEVPASCTNNATCQCMGASVCLAPHDTCADAKDALICSCPNC